MSSFIIANDTLHIIGIVYSAVGIALSVLGTLLLKAPARALDYIQWGYFLAVVMNVYSVSIPFST